MKGGIIVTVLVVLSMVQAMVKPGQGLNCMDVTANLVQCTSYLTGGVAQPTEVCCQGVRKLKGMATTTPVRRQMCSCIKEAASNNQMINDAAAASLPAKCGAPLSFAVSKNIDCNSIP
ncbi:hypothetical protein ACHQM5_017803 [Ranunculus cassubicifolius]